MICYEEKLYGEFHISWLSKKAQIFCFHLFDVVFLSLPFRSFIYDAFFMIKFLLEWEMKNEAIEQGFLWQPRHAGKFDFSLKALTFFFFFLYMNATASFFYNSNMISFTWHHHLLFKYAHRSLLWHSKWYGNKK